MKKITNFLSILALMASCSPALADYQNQPNIKDGFIDGTVIVSPSITNKSIQQGSLEFAGVNGLETQNNANLFWDNTNLRLGIGTSAPVAPLDARIAGSTGAVEIGPWINNQSLGALYFSTAFQTANSYSIVGGPTADLYFNRPSNQQIHFREANGTDEMEIYAGGYVNIGTTSQTTAPLVVGGAGVSGNMMTIGAVSGNSFSTFAGASGASNYIQFTNGGTGILSIGENAGTSYLFDQVNGGNILSNSSAGLLLIGQTNSLRLPKTGNVGMGPSSSAPTQVLDVYGNIAISGHLMWTNTQSTSTITVSSGFGTGAAFTTGTTQAFRFNVGTGGSASTGTLTLPTPTSGWNCSVSDITTPAGNNTQFTGASGATVSFTNYSRTTGLATAWPASDVLAISCTGI